MLTLPLQFIAPGKTEEKKKAVEKKADDKKDGKSEVAKAAPGI